MKGMCSKITLASSSLAFFFFVSTGTGHCQEICTVVPVPYKVANGPSDFKGNANIDWKWDSNKTLRVLFRRNLGGFPSNDYIVNVASQWSRYGNIDFVKVDNFPADIVVDFAEGQGCWSTIGYQSLLRIKAGKPSMNFDPIWFKNNLDANILHEFGHAIGLLHEHQHAAATIPWNRSAVYAYYSSPDRVEQWDAQKVDDQIFNLSEPRHAITPYDPLSIMHYFIDPSLLLNNDTSYKVNTRLSEGDKHAVRILYGLSEERQVNRTPVYSGADEISAYQWTVPGYADKNNPVIGGKDEFDNFTYPAIAKCNDCWVPGRVIKGQSYGITCYGGQLLTSPEFAVLANRNHNYSYIPFKGGIIPENALRGGTDSKTGKPLFFARGKIAGRWVPGKWLAGSPHCWVPYDGREQLTEEFELLGQFPK